MDEKKIGNGEGPDKQAVLTAKLKASTARARAHLVCHLALSCESS